MSRRGYPKTDYGSERVTGRWTYPVGSPYEYDFSSSYTSSAQDSVGGNTPGWPHVVQVNSFSGFRASVRYSPAHWTGTDSSSGGQGAGTWPMRYISGISDPPALFQEAANRSADQAQYLCISKLIARIKNQKVNVGVLAAEFSKTCGTVTNAAQRIASSIRQLKSGNAGGALSTLLGGRRGGKGDGAGGGKRPKHRPPNSGSVASDWLALQYGWKPFLSDVYGSVEELARTATYRPPGNRVTARSVSEESVTTFIGKTAPNQPDCQARGKVRSSCQGTVEYEVLSETAEFIANTGLLNPLSVAWELVPYSFVADWFLPVGSYLNNLDYDLGLKFLKGWVTTKTLVSGHVESLGGTHSSGATTQTWSGGYISCEVSGITRQGMGSFPAVPYPRWKDPISLSHALNAIALLRTAF